MKASSASRGDLVTGHRRALSRRGFLEAAGRVGAGAAIGGLLAACGIAGSSDGDEGADRSAEELPPLAEELVIAHWPLYIDKVRGKSPTLQMFERSTGIDVTYKEVINDNQEFFATISEPLSQGQATGWDIVTLSDWVVAKMWRAGWLEELDHSLLPNVKKNLGDLFRDPPYDPGNAHSVPWQGGITGIAYNPKLTGRKLTAFADLWDTSLAGHVGMLTEMVDTMNLTLLSLGVDPQQATVDDAARAQRRLLELRDKGIVRDYYGNDYVDGLARGDLWATMAWSGDVFQLRLNDPDLEFVVPEEGGILWSTPLEIPQGAKHPRDAHVFMDFVYRPDIAAQITEWVGYISPVAGARAVVEEHAAAAQGADARYLDTLAKSPLVFPTPEMEAKLHSYKVLSEDEEASWNDLFQEAMQG
ncbi:MAG: spermidine/putrescine ABC transporter substrate-binding protein [Actinomycetota bacterium]